MIRSFVLKATYCVHQDAVLTDTEGTSNAEAAQTKGVQQADSVMAEADAPVQVLTHQLATA